MSHTSKIVSSCDLINSVEITVEKKMERSTKIFKRPIDSLKCIVVNDEKTIAEQNRIPGSFRDPSGFVFSRERQIFRQIND